MKIGAFMRLLRSRLAAAAGQAGRRKESGWVKSSAPAKPKNLEEVTKAATDASSLASGLWLSFILFGAYYVISVGAVTHDDLFLEKPAKLPVLGTELPLKAFFIVAPFIFVIYHFYLLLQLSLLAGKIGRFNAVLREEITDAAMRSEKRALLPPHIFIQMLAGPADERKGIKGRLLRLIAWLSMFVLPLLALVLTLVQFLPYHGEGVSWAQRLAILLDGGLLTLIWPSVIAGDGLIALTVARSGPSAAGAVFAAIFACSVAVFPGEFAYDGWDGGAHWAADQGLAEDRLVLFGFGLPGAQALTKFLFESPVNQVSGQRARLLSNTLVLPDRTFVSDDLLAKKRNEPTLSLRGRDLRGAVFSRSDLRQADFTGAMLDGAILREARLQKARFGCADTGDTKVKTGALTIRELPWPNHGCASLNVILANGADISEADFARARMTGARLTSAMAKGANFRRAQLQGANLDSVNLAGAELSGAHLQAASLVMTRFLAANLTFAQVQASWVWHADFRWAQLESMQIFQSHGEKPILARARGTVGAGEIYTNEPLLAAPPDAFGLWRARLLGRGIGQNLAIVERLNLLAPDHKAKRSDSLEPDIWHWGVYGQVPQFDRWLAELTARLCQSEDAPFVARGLLRNGQLEIAGKRLGDIATMMRKGLADPASCPGILGFQMQDWLDLEALIRIVEAKP